MRSRRAALMLSLALLAGTVLAAKLPTAGAAAPGCPCVVLIEVDGLEPKDVTKETTPFLWALAHPQDPEVGELVEDTRAGWTWQAPRSVMTAGTAANAGALLTGGYPEQHGVPADEFLNEGAVRTRLEQNPLDAQQIIWQTYASELLPHTIAANPDLGKEAAMFVGNPALSGLTDSEDIPPSLKWYPTNTDPENPPSPAYCDIPRNVPDDPEGETSPYEPKCSAPDLVTTNRALDGLNGPDGGKVAFTYMHLAELGVIKRRDGDVAPSDYAEISQEEAAAARSVPHALAQTDAAIAQFIQRYMDETASPVTGPKWDSTFVFVVGNHGYEMAPQVKRLPAPLGAAEPDLETYVEKSGNLEYSPYGSMATVHATSGTAAEQQRELEAIAVQLRRDGQVEAACRTLMPESPQGHCIKEVLYVRDGVLPSPSASDAKSLAAAHPNWNLDHMRSTGVASRSSGELLVITEPGWGAGRGAPVQQTTGEDGTAPVSDNPDSYLGVAGGPRNRAVAAIVNGPGGEQGVRPLPAEVSHYPVRKGDDDPATTTLDPSPADPAFESVFDANRDPTDDTGKDGYERQPETIDFAPTIAALLGVGIEGGLPDETRFLQEAFLRELKFPDLADAPEPVPTQCADGSDNDGDGNVDLADAGCSSPEDDDESDEPLPPPPAPQVIVLPPPPVPAPPPPPKAWSYSGLVRNLRAAVGDKRGRIFPNVRPRSSLEYLILRADFGKPLAAVKLSFYKQQRTEQGRAGRRRVVVKTLASFDPFSIRRAKNARLTLKVPKVFKPTHVGVVVQRARRLSGREATLARRRKLPLFKAYGARKGGIYRIKNARRMHTIAPQRKRRR